MPHKPWRIPDATGIEWTIIDLLLEHPRPWRVEELIDVIDSPTAVTEALEALHATGLIERTDAFVRIAPEHR
jgi:DNA-binding HxlR family transcriptional regulator